MMVNYPISPDSHLLIREIDDTTGNITDEVDVVTRVTRIVLMVYRILRHTIVVAGDHDDGTRRARQLFSRELKTWRFHPVVIEQITGNQQQVHFKFDRLVDD